MSLHVINGTRSIEFPDFASARMLEISKLLAGEFEDIRGIICIEYIALGRFKSVCK